MFCHKCGKELLNDAQFCSYCGTKIEIPISNNDTNIKLNSPMIADENIDMKEIHTSNNNQNEKRDNTKLEWLWNKIKSGSSILLLVLCLAFSKVVGRMIASDRNTMRFLSYAIPGLLCGVLFGIIPYVVLIKCTSFEKKKSYLVMILLGGGIAGLIGGLMFSVPYAVILSVIIFALHKIDNKE